MVKYSKIQSVLMYLDKKPLWVHYCFVMLAVSLAALTTYLLPAIAQRAAFLLFFFSIIQTAFWMGLSSGILALLLSFLTVNAFILWPNAIHPRDLIILNMGFGFVSTAMIFTASQLKDLTSSLWQSQQDLDFAQSVGQIGSWRLNLQLNKLDWSDENYRIFGIPEGNTNSYESFLAIVHPSDREYVDSQWNAALRGEPYDIEHRIVVDGNIKWVRERAILEFDRKGKLLAGFGTTQDITESKNAKLALEINRLRYQGIIDSMRDAVITVSPNQCIIYVNSAVEKMFGHPAQEFIGSFIDRYIPEIDGYFYHIQSGVISAFGIHDNKQRGEMAPVKGIRANNQAFPIEASIIPTEIDGIKSYTFILRDISDRVQAAEVLQEQIKLQDQLVKVAASVPGVIYSFRLDLEGTSSMPYASPAFESVFGFKSEKVAKDFNPVFERIHPDDINHLQESINQSALTLQPWQGHLRYDHPSKGQIWIEGHSMPRVEKDGNILWHGYVQDVTERINAEKNLQERIERYQLVLDGAQDAIWDWDVANKSVNYSSRWKELRGYSEDEVGDDEQLWSANIHPDDRERVLAALQDHFAGKSSVFCEEYRVQCKNGSWKWILDRGLALKNSAGDVIRMAGSESDITARKLAEDAINEQRMELRLIMDATPALISYLDTEFRYVRVNATYESWFNISAEQIIGKHAEEILGLAAWKIVEPHLKHVRAGGQASFESQIPYKGRELHWVRANYLPNIDATGVVHGIVVHVFDIDALKMAEKKISTLNKNLQRKVHELEVFFDTVPIGLSIAHDKEGLHIHGNLVLERMMGFPPGSEMSRRSNDSVIYTPMENGIGLAIQDLPMQRAATGEVVKNQVLEISYPNGKAITLLSNAAPLYDEEGQVRGAVGAFLDITGLRQAEELLRQSQLQLRLFVEQAPLSMAMLDRDMNYLVTSQLWTQEFGGGIKELEGLNHYEVIPNIPAKWRRAHQQALAGDFLKKDEDLWILPDGSKRWYRWAVRSWTNVSGEIGGIIISCEDITSRCVAEEELKSTQAQLALVVEHVKAGYFVFDLNKGTIFISPELKRQIGADENENPTIKQWKYWINRLHHDDRAYVAGTFKTMLTDNKPGYELTFRLRLPDASYRWIHSRGVMLYDRNHQPYRMVGISFDDSEHIKQKELNEQRDKMEKTFRLNVAIQTGAAIAHELNQPLAAITSYADVALHLLEKGNPDLQKLHIAIKNCTIQAQRAGLSIRQLMTLLHRDESISSAFDARSLIWEAVAYVKAEKRYDDSKMKLALADNLPMVYANSIQMQKVLVNLLHNGLESMEQAKASTGTLTVLAGILANDPAMVEIIVCDEGTGVADKSELKKIFQPFYTTKPTGLGMGLAVSKSLVETHTGKMWAEQNADKGISIHFTLPIATKSLAS